MKSAIHPFVWDSYYVTHLHAVDKQHLHLVKLINALAELASSGKTIPRETVEQLFAELTAYAQYHFTEEEGLMGQHKLDPRHIQYHHAEHRQFVDDLQSLYENTLADIDNEIGALLNYLTYWLAYHILGVDQNMAAQIHRVEKGESPASAYEQESDELDNSTKPLLKALNGLFKEVTSQNKKLLEMNRSLETRVQARTRELQEAMQRLEMDQEKIVRLSEDLKLINGRLEELSLTDSLTNLPNRRSAMRFLEEQWLKRKQQPISCLMIDADHFKEVNDQWGHDAGDVVLQRLAQTLQDFSRTDDLACRVGGDEFMVICPNTSAENALSFAQALLARVNTLWVPAGSGFWEGSVSVGVATNTDDMTTMTDLIKAADEALYAAKAAGKNCVRQHVSA
ncbi:MAG: diguanylate cyclase [Gammaproteobacteria bacterium]|nr:diguanylate cyclase [Gammaproteobacteria bacterium]